MKFELTEKQKEDLAVWQKTIYAKGVAKQKLVMKNPDFFTRECWDQGYPYTGAIGGQFIYSFIPTGLGDIVKVKDSVTGEEINLTDYESW